MIADLQELVGGNPDPYKGTFAVSLVETTMFGCGISNSPPPPPNPVQPYLNRQGISSVSVRSASFVVESDGSLLHVPDFEELTQELRLSGKYETSTHTQDALELVIGGDGSLQADFDDSQLRGQFARDGSMFSALVTGRSLDTSDGCEDVWTATLTGVRK
jgi:hypothetical protein